MRKSPYEIANSRAYAPSVSRAYFKVEVKEISPGFKGLYALEAIPKGAVIACDGGSVVSSLDDHICDNNYVALLDENLWLAPADYDAIEPIYFLNHSCDPNVARYGGLIYVAKRDIAAGTELTGDYAPFISGYGDYTLTCSCGSAKCRKIVTSSDWEREDLATALWEEWLPFVQKKIMKRRMA